MQPKLFWRKTGRHYESGPWNANVKKRTQGPEACLYGHDDPTNQECPNVLEHKLKAYLSEIPACLWRLRLGHVRTNLTYQKIQNDTNI